MVNTLYLLAMTVKHTQAELHRLVTYTQGSIFGVGLCCCHFEMLQIVPAHMPSFVTRLCKLGP